MVWWGYSSFLLQPRLFKAYVAGRGKVGRITFHGSQIFAPLFLKELPVKIIKLGSDDTPSCRTYHKCIVTVLCIYKICICIHIIFLYIQYTYRFCIFQVTLVPDGPRWSAKIWRMNSFGFRVPSILPRKIIPLRLVRLLMAEILAPFGMYKTRRK